MQTIKNILVLGGINHDLIITTPRIPKIGETVIGSHFATASGGKAANQAVAAKRLGGSVALIGAVGDDEPGRRMTLQFAQEGIDISGINVIPDAPTGTAMITLYRGDNFIIMDPGANAALQNRHIDRVAPLFEGAGILLVQMEIPAETLLHAVKLAKILNVTVLLDPAPANGPLSDEIWPYIDIVKPNETECTALTGIDALNPDNAQKAVKFFLDRDVRQVFITLGDKGIIYNENDKINRINALAVPNVIDTTAAGDCFSAALAVALTEGAAIHDAARFANAAAAVSVTRLGAQPSLPMRNEVNA